MFHSGNTTMGAGAPGRRSLRVRSGGPVLIADLAAELPYLQILIAYPAFPLGYRAIRHLPAEGQHLHGPLWVAPEVYQRLGVAVRPHHPVGRRDIRDRLPDARPAAVAEEFADPGWGEDLQRKVLWEDAERFLGLDQASVRRLLRCHTGRGRSSSPRSRWRSSARGTPGP